MISVNDELELGKAILDEIGINIGPDHILIDDETGVPVQFNGKNIKFSVTQPQIYIGEGDVKFDPAHNYRMMNTMLGLYLDREYGDNVTSVHEDFDRAERMTSHTIRMKNRDITSGKYKNRCLALCDNVLQLANFDNDLSKFDDKEEE